MKAVEKWPEFMRAGSEPTASAPSATRSDEGELEIDAAPEIRPRANPQGRTARPGRKPLRAQARAVPKPGRGKRLFSMFLAGASVGVVGVAAFFGYFWFMGGGGGGQSQVPTIQALDDPVKVKPENPGGLEVPYQDKLVLNQPGSEGGSNPTVERLLPPPEAPKPLVDTTAAATVPQPASPSPSAVASIVVPQSQPATAPSGSSAPSSSSSASNGAAVISQPQAPAQPQTQNGTNLAAAPATPAVNGSTANGSAGSTTLGATNVQAALPATTQPAAPAKGSYLLQLGSFNSAKVGEGAWEGFQKKHPDLLAGMVLFLQEAEVNGKTYHRVQAGPFPNRATAIDLCAELKSRNQDCLVIKR